MKDLVELMVRSLVEFPEDIEINEIEGEKTIMYEVRVREEDLGRVIGKRGRIVNAMRTIVKAATVKDNRKAILEILQ